MEVTIKDIAERAEVSYATVSRALNNKYGVHEKTRKKVLSIAAEMEYSPNAVARGLVKKRTHTLGLIIPDITNPFYPGVARGIEDGAAEAGFSVILCNSNWERGRERQYIDLVAEKRVDGVILAPIENRQEMLKTSYTDRIPVVYVDKAPKKTRNSFVVIDNIRGGFLATKHLIEQGYDTIGFIGASEESWYIDERLQGYKMAFEQYGLSIREEFIRLSDFKQDTGHKIICEMIDTGDYPRSVFAENDLLALGVMQGVRERGLRIPQDVAVVGFDDIPFAGFPEIQLSTIYQPKYEMGKKAVEVLIEQIESGRAAGTKIYLEPQLVVRGSSF